MELLFHIDLLSVGITVAATGVLGFIILLSDRKNATNRSFAYFCVVTVIWGILNYLNYQTNDEVLALWMIRLVMFFAILQASAFYFILSTFPDKVHKFTWFEAYILNPFVGVVALFTLTPLVFSAVHYTSGNIVAQPIPGRGVALFGIAAFLCVALGIRNSIVKLRKSSHEERRQFIPILSGAIIMFALIIVFNFIFSVVLNNTSLIPLSSIFTFPFVFLTFYAVSRHNLFNVKVLTTAILTVALALVTFSEVVVSQGVSAIIFRSIEFVLVLLFGSLIIRSVIKEIEAREEIDKLAKELAKTNSQLEVSNERLRILDQRKSEFVSIASHQLRTPVTAIKGYTSLLLEDAYGKLPEAARDPIEKIFLSTQRLVNMINDFLNVSKIEQNTMTYTFAPLDLKKMVIDLVGDFHIVAGEKKIDLATDIPDGPNFFVVADEGKIRQIISNLIDNAIKYTPQGSVRLLLTKEENKDNIPMIHLQIKDTGIGLSQDDIHHLFGKFTRGSEGSKVNTTGSGLGLYVAKKMMEEHKGDIWVDSEGKGKGSVFSILLPEFRGELPKA